MSRTVEVELNKGETLTVQNENGQVVHEETGLPEQKWEELKRLEEIRENTLDAKSLVESTLDNHERTKVDTELMEKELQKLLNEKWYNLLPEVGREVTTFPSSSRPGVEHTVLVLPDDQLVCTCEQFRYNRDCKHVREVKAREPQHKLAY